MKKVKDFGNLSKAEFTELRRAIEAALKPVAAQYGLTFTAGSLSYLGGEANMRLKIMIEGGETREAHDFKMFAESYDLKADDLGREFAADGKTFKVVGLNTRKHNNNIILESGGKKYNANCGWVSRHLHLQKVTSRS